MPVGVKCKTVRSGYDGRGNDEILQLGREACDATAAAHDAPIEGRALLLAKAFDLRTRELDAWNRLPDKDAIGISMCCNGLANVCLLRHQTDPSDPSNTTEDAHTWYARAEAALNGLTDSAANAQRELVRENRARLMLFEGTRLLHKTVRVHGLNNPRFTMYNGRTGYVAKLQEYGKYLVRLQATADAPVVELIVKERNLQLFGEQVAVPREGSLEI